jgi:hypothetical protein
VYTRRRILAILGVLLLSALLVPRTCQALLGSGEDAGSSQDRQAGAVGAANEAGAEEGATEDAGNAGADSTDAGNTGAGSTDAKKSEGDDPSSRGAPFVDDGPGDGGAPGTEDGDEAAPDLAAMMTELAVIGGGEIPAAGSGQSSGAGAPSPSGTGGEPLADEHPMSETQFALAASPTPAEQPANTRRAPSTESEPAERAAAPGAKAKRAPRAAEWASSRGDLTPPTLAVSRAGPEERGARRTRIEPAEPVLTEPAEPVLTEPAEPVLTEPPAPIPHDRAFVGNPRSGVARGVANNYGGNAAGALHGAPAFNRAVATPRLPAVLRAAPAAATRGAGAAAARPVAF